MVVTSLSEDISDFFFLEIFFSLKDVSLSICFSFFFNLIFILKSSLKYSETLSAHSSKETVKKLIESSPYIEGLLTNLYRDPVGPFIEDPFPIISIFKSLLLACLDAYRKGSSDPYREDKRLRAEQRKMTGVSAFGHLLLSILTLGF